MASSKENQMAEKLTRLEVNCETGEVKEIELTELEIAERNAAAEAWEAEQAARQLADLQRAEARQAAITKLAALGLTEAEVQALLGA
jgi:hypothetical protein